MHYFSAFLLILAIGCEGGSESASNSNTPSGKGGSMARFAISGDKLYTIAENNLRVFDITDASKPTAGKTILLGSNVETIFPYNDNLFFGTTTGMLIYDNSTPDQPSYISRFDHITSCDPVVVEGRYAYVTLRTGTNCRNGWNRLDIVDLIKIDSPKLVVSYDMYNPHGLGIDDSLLFVCDNGLKVYNAKNPLSLTVLAEYKGIDAYDVIPNKSILVMTGDDGIFQYDYSDPMNIREVSKMVVK